MRQTFGEKVFGCFNVLILLLLTIVTLYPFLNVLAVSLSDYTVYLQNPLMIIPSNIDLGAYKNILTNPLLASSYRNTIFITVVGTFVNISLTLLTAYPLSKSHFKGGNIIMMIIIFSMMFSGGIIPNYYLIRKLGLINSLWSLILPGSISAYNLILMRNFLSSIPESLEESARIDGASDVRILFSIVVPLSLSAISSISLFYAVTNWNIFFSAIMYTTDRDKWTLQLLLREIVLQANQTATQAADTAEVGANIYPQTLKSATIIATVLPILLIYPFLQKYFVQGVMVGSVKE